MRATIAVALFLAGCSDTRGPQERRESMVRECIARNLNPQECAQAAEMAIPRSVR